MFWPPPTLLQDGTGRRRRGIQNSGYVNAVIVPLGRRRLLVGRGVEEQQSAVWERRCSSRATGWTRLLQPPTPNILRVSPAVVLAPAAAAAQTTQSMLGIELL